MTRAITTALLRTTALGGLAMTAACATAPAMTAPDFSQPVAFGGFSAPESATYDAAADRYFITSMGVFGQDELNDGYISTLNPDGSVQSVRWSSSSDEVELRSPLGAAIYGGSLYVADGQNVRLIDLETGDQTSVLTVEDATNLNDLAIASDGTVYATNTGEQDMPDTWAIYRITSEGTVTTFASGEVLGWPNGVELNADGDVVTVGLGSTNLRVFSAGDGSLLETVALPSAGNDGLIVLEDSYIVSSVFDGTVVEVTGDGETTVLAEGLEAAASIGYDPTRDRVIVPQLFPNIVTFIDRE